MKRLMWVICALLLAAGMNAQTKSDGEECQESSGWMNTAVDDYLIVSVTVGSLAEGQSKVLQEITGNVLFRLWQITYLYPKRMSFRK